MNKRWSIIYQRWPNNGPTLVQKLTNVGPITDQRWSNNGQRNAE